MKGGRPKGSRSKKTLEKEAALEEFQRRVRVAINPLFESQMTIARGCSYLYRIERTGKGKDAKEKHVLVTDPDEIARYLNDELEDDHDYYYITTERPDNKAIDSLLDRTFGKAPQAVDLKAQIKIAPDDIRALIPTLSPAEQKQAYVVLAKLIAQHKRPGQSGTAAA